MCSFALLSVISNGVLWFLLPWLWSGAYSSCLLQSSKVGDRRSWSLPRCLYYFISWWGQWRFSQVFESKTLRRLSKCDWRETTWVLNLSKYSMLWFGLAMCPILSFWGWRSWEYTRPLEKSFTYLFDNMKENEQSILLIHQIQCLKALQLHHKCGSQLLRRAISSSNSSDSAIVA